MQNWKKVQTDDLVHIMVRVNELMFLFSEAIYFIAEPSQVKNLLKISSKIHRLKLKAGITVIPVGLARIYMVYLLQQLLLAS